MPPLVKPARRQQAYRAYLKFLAAHAGHGHSAVPPGGDAERGLPVVQ